MSEFVFDIDGTICFDYKDLREDAIMLLDEIESKGHEVIFASARPVRDMVPVIKDKYANHRLIGGNGVMVFKDGVKVASKGFDPILFKNILKILSEEHAVFLVDSMWDYHYNGDGTHELMEYVDQGKRANNVAVDLLDVIIKCIVFEADDMEKLYARLSELPVELSVHERTGTIDIIATHSNKYEALKEQGITDYIAMGNDINDIELLKNAKIGIMIDHNETLAPFSTHSVESDENYRNNILEIMTPYL